MSKNKFRTALTLLILILVIPLAVIQGAVVFKGRHYAWVALCVAVLSLLPLFYSFERRESSSKEFTVLAVMIALSVMGRFVFAWLPGFKPITAVTVIAAVYLGKEAGFIIGAMSGVVSNFYFGQGPWTPFQMFAWGFIGFIAGVFAKPLKNSKILLCMFGALSGLLYSLTMDVWTTLWADGAFDLSRYTAAVITALPVTAEYALSNIIFLLILAKPIGEKLERIKKKYGLFVNKLS